MAIRDWYDRAILPKIITCACGQKEIARLRGKVVPQASGSVFEIGCGGGLNQQFYDRSRVTAFAGIDPSGALLDKARAAAREKGWEADIRQGVGEAIPFADDSFDTVVCTYTLCSVDGHAQTLSELRRILKPGGRFLFLEHGRAPDAGVARWQDRIEPVWKRMLGNCHLSRPVADAVSASGFEVAAKESLYLPKTPRFAGFMEWGEARKLA